MKEMAAVGGDQIIGIAAIDNKRGKRPGRSMVSGKGDQSPL